MNGSIFCFEYRLTYHLILYHLRISWHLTQLLHHSFFCWIKISIIYAKTIHFFKFSCKITYATQVILQFFINSHSCSLCTIYYTPIYIYDWIKHFWRSPLGLRTPSSLINILLFLSVSCLTVNSILCCENCILA